MRTDRETVRAGEGIVTGVTFPGAVGIDPEHTPRSRRGAPGCAAGAKVVVQTDLMVSPAARPL